MRKGIRRACLCCHLTRDSAVLAAARELGCRSAVPPGLAVWILFDRRSVVPPLRRRGCFWYQGGLRRSRGISRDVLDGWEFCLEWDFSRIFFSGPMKEGVCFYLSQKYTTGYVFQLSFVG